MIRVALTGGIACGKTTVCNLFAELGTPIIDTDLIARDLVEPGNPALEKITAYFGSDILLPDGTLNRKLLANITFGDTTKRKHLESILHPEITKVIDFRIRSLDSAYVIIAIPLLVETAQTQTYDRVLVIDCDEKQQIQRTLQRDQRSREEVNNIMSSQVNRLERLTHADDIINNNSDIKSLKPQIAKLHKLYTNLSSTT